VTRLKDLAATIVREVAAADRAGAAYHDHARAAGAALIEAKAQVRHGEWLPWLAENCGLTERTAQHWMRFARGEVETLDQSRPKSALNADMDPEPTPLRAVPDRVEPPKRRPVGAVRCQEAVDEAAEALRRVRVRDMDADARNALTAVLRQVDRIDRDLKKMKKGELLPLILDLGPMVRAGSD
jgi:hypothetical protein